MSPTNDGLNMTPAALFTSSEVPLPTSNDTSRVSVPRDPTGERAADRERLLGGHAIRDDATAIAAPLRAAAELTVVADTLQPGAIRVHDVEIRGLQALPAPLRERHVAAAARCECDPCAVRRPRWTEIAAGFGREGLHALRCDVHRPQRAKPPCRVLTNTSCFPSGDTVA